jgi:Tfp pilus assembly protein PilN
VRAANLMPGEDRASRAVKSVDTGGILYVLLAGLAAFVALAAVWATANKQVGEGRAKVDRVTAQAQVAEARIARAAPYQAFAALARDRVATVTSLSATRFDWAHGLREVSRVLPDDVWLTSLSGASGATSEAPSPTTSAAPAPTFELLGCTGNQAKVARLMARLRAVDGVRDVDLRTSSKPDAGSSAGTADCPAAKASNPRFTIAIAFAVPGAAKAAVDETGTVTDASAAVSSAPAGTSAAPPTPAPPSTASDSSTR